MRGPWALAVVFLFPSHAFAAQPGQNRTCRVQAWKVCPSKLFLLSDAAAGRFARTEALKCATEDAKQKALSACRGFGSPVNDRDERAENCETFAISDNGAFICTVGYSLDCELPAGSQAPPSGEKSPCAPVYYYERDSGIKRVDGPGVCSSETFRDRKLVESGREEAKACAAKKAVDFAEKFCRDGYRGSHVNPDRDGYVDKGCSFSHSFSGGWFQCVAVYSIDCEIQPQP